VEGESDMPCNSSALPTGASGISSKLRFQLGCRVRGSERLPAL
jgi:hypothetical protein